MGRQWNTIIESLGPLSGGTGLSINANLTELEALVTTLQADVADGIIVTSGTVTSNNQSVYSSGALTLSGTSALNTDLIPSTDVTAYQEVLVQVIGTWPTGATIQHQVSNDNVNFGSIVASTANSSSSTLSSTITAVGSYKVILNGFAYYRLRVTVAGSTGTYSYAYSLNPRSSVFNTSVSVTSMPTTSVNISTTANAGHSTHHTAISAATTNATNVKSSSANIGLIIISNVTSNVAYFKLFNLAVAPTMGTSSPVLNYPIQPNTTLAIDCGFAGIRLTTGLSYAITGGQALLDTTAVGAGDVVVNISYT